MSTLAYILLLLATTASIGLFPLLKRVFDQLGVNVSQKQFDLLRKVVEESVSYVNQMSLSRDMTSSEKKELAISTAKTLADTFGIPANKQSPICDLIESVLWAEDEPDTDTDDDFDD